MDTMQTAAKRKTRRVPKACDDCRIRKTRCNGQLPCSTCTMHQYGKCSISVIAMHVAQSFTECSYESPRKARRSGVEYIHRLEKELERLESLLTTSLPEAGIQHSAKENGVGDEMQASAPLVRARSQKADMPSLKPQTRPQQSTSSPDSLLETMVEATGRLDIDDSGNCDYNGNFAGLVLLRRIQERCSRLLRRDIAGEVSAMPSSLPQPFKSPSSPPSVSEDKRNLLPSSAVALELVSFAFDCGLPLLPFIHRPTFESLLEQSYASGPRTLDVYGQRFLALLFEVLALGEMFSKRRTEVNALSNTAEYKGDAYFRAGQSLVDITDCRDLTSLQASVCMIIYLHSSSTISTCYSRICLALASSARMGLHRSVASDGLGAVDRENRKRIFWVLRTMDTYITTTLGLPRTLSDDDIDQELPCEVEDELMGEQTSRLMPLSQRSSMTAFNAHTKLIWILAKVVKYVHSEGKANCEKSGLYRVAHARIIEVEADLAAWFDELPQPAIDDGLMPLDFTRWVICNLPDAQETADYLENPTTPTSSLRACPDGSLPPIPPSPYKAQVRH
ncbi:fungal-specific transcription factor domain-containing protein [Cryomyces antarcticus]